jgi:hypothetical protein
MSDGGTGGRPANPGRIERVLVGLGILGRREGHTLPLLVDAPETREDDALSGADSEVAAQFLDARAHLDRLVFGDVEPASVVQMRDDLELCEDRVVCPRGRIRPGHRQDREARTHQAGRPNETHGGRV